MASTNPESTPECIYIELDGPTEESLSIIRLSDTFRKEWTLEADSPPGFYYQGNEIVPHDIQLHYDVPDSTEPEREHSGSSSSGHSGDLETGSNAGSSPARSSFEDTDLTDVSVDGEDEALLKFDDDSYADVPGENQRDTTHLNNIFQVTNLVELVKSSGASKQYYHVQLTTTQLVGIHQQDTTFELLVDTGSNTTWLRGKDICKTVEVIRQPAASSTSKVKQGKGPELQFRVMAIPSKFLANRAQLFGEDIQFPHRPKDDNISVIISQWDGYVSYASPETLSRAVVLVLPKRPREFYLENCFGWKDQRDVSWPTPLSLVYRPGVAICGAEKDVFAPVFDGILGLGTTRYDPAYVRRSHNPGLPSEDVPTFSTVLSERLVRLPGGRSEIIIFFMLRPPVISRRRASQLRPSYFAYQKWPCLRVPRWSPNIPVIDEVDSGKWKVFLQLMRIWRGINAVTASIDNMRGREAIVNIPIERLVMLDTGASSSYLPRKAIDILSVERSPFAEIPTRPRPYAPFYYDASNLDDLTVEMVFKADDQPISVFVPALSFLYNAVGEGLVWPCPDYGSRSRHASGILGIGFFQVVYASFHLPNRGPRVTPYIRLAPQTAAETAQGLYTVPPLTQ